VIGGYTEPEGSRKHFGALLVGFYEGKIFKFAGRVGTGFSEKLLASLAEKLEFRVAHFLIFRHPVATDGIRV
jgi:bifunctional non-homologous end joining protein LigD